MKTLIIGLLLIGSTSVAFAGTNLSDTIDANEVPASVENREEEVINHPDAVDRNNVPSTLEDRQNEEEWREGYDQEQKDTEKRQNKVRQ